jgi:hypothetical protein
MRYAGISHQAEERAEANRYMGLGDHGRIYHRHIPRHSQFLIYRSPLLNSISVLHPGGTNTTLPAADGVIDQGE